MTSFKRGDRVRYQHTDKSIGELQQFDGTEGAVVYPTVVKGALMVLFDKDTIDPWWVPVEDVTPLS